jgi:hypothetical protein
MNKNLALHVLLLILLIIATTSYAWEKNAHNLTQRQLDETSQMLDRNFQLLTQCHQISDDWLTMLKETKQQRDWALNNLGATLNEWDETVQDLQGCYTLLGENQH